MNDDAPEIASLRQRLEEEERAYARVLAAVDALAAFPSLAERWPDLPRQMERLNELWKSAEPEPGGGLSGHHQRAVWRALAPALSRQEAFNSAVVQALNHAVDELHRLHDHVRELVARVIAHLQRVQPLVDARDRMASALATTRSELILEAFDRRQEDLSRRIAGLTALRDRLETASEQIQALRGALFAKAPAPEVAAAAERAFEGATYSAFENRFRGPVDEIRERLSTYVDSFRDLGTVVDLGCGRGEFLDLLRQSGIASKGVDANAASVNACRKRGLDVVEGDLVRFLRTQDASSLGGVFAAQVVEHLPPADVQTLLEAAHRALRPGGLLVLETVNPRSVVGLLEVFNRDLTHQKPMHPDTLSFLAAAAGFTDVAIEYRSPVPPHARLSPIPTAGLSEDAARALNENVERLNALLYGPQEFALFARR